MSKQIIAITGANGQLGQELKTLSVRFPQLDCRFLSREDLPIEDDRKVAAFFEDVRPDWCVNCAAYTAVDKAETEPDQARLINATAVGHLAAACRQAKARFIHISTDYVFDGSSSTPLKEDHATAPLNVYGETKLRGEQLAMQQDPDSIVIRTSWVYSPFGNNFVKTMIRLMKERPSLNVVNDQIGSPTYAADLAAAIFRIITGNNFKPGIYHYSNQGQISWYDFALAIKELTGSNCIVNPIPTSQFPTPAKRPHYSLLDKSLIRETYGLTVPDWKDSLADCLRRLNSRQA